MSLKNNGNHPFHNTDLEPVSSSKHLPSTDYYEERAEWDEETLNLRDYLDVIIRRRWLIIGIVFFSFITTLIYSMTLTKLFKSSATIEIAPQTPKVTKFDEVVASEIHQRDFLETQVALLQSKTLILRAIKKMGFPDNPFVAKSASDGKNQEATGRLKQVIEFFKPDTDEKETTPSLLSEALIQQKQLAYFQNNLSITPQKNSRLITLTFVSSDRLLSQQVVNTLADEYVLWEMDKKLQASDFAQQFLKKQIERAKIVLEKSEEELNRFARLAGIVSLDAKLSSVYSQLEVLNADLAHTESELILKKATYFQAAQTEPSNLPQVLASEMIAKLNIKYSDLLAEYEKLAVSFRDSYPQVKAVKSRMASIADRINLEEHKIFKALQSDYSIALEKKQAMQERVNEQKKRALELNERATQYKILAREVETNKGIYQSLLERAKEIESMVGVSASNIYIVDRPSIPIYPFKPRVRSNLLLALVIGLLCGIGAAFAQEYFADTITNPEQISGRFQIPILGVVPLIKTDGGMIEKIFLADSRAPLTESIRTAKVSIQLSGTDLKTFLITSTAPSEGKTTLASNLALAFSSAGEKVILIDADLRKPRLHKIFTKDFSNGHSGLSSFLAGVKEQCPIRSDEAENLEIVFAGPIPPNPVELLASGRFQQLMADLEERYDRIILDAPPHHGFADILVLSQRVDGVILVGNMGSTTRTAVRHFKTGMMNVNASILGCIINKVNLTKRYGYNAYYKYYQTYSYSDKSAKELEIT
ncbi:polysaccharide biosynthesis tyrosine autokinase [Desulfococcaceae bacterium HSG9]|nr:polysaccharide biosynthesis tyrosine autokinase [Desulfococcaceae bacterium HSG9]